MVSLLFIVDNSFNVINVFSIETADLYKRAMNILFTYSVFYKIYFSYSELSQKNRFYSVTHRSIVPI